MGSDWYKFYFGSFYFIGAGFCLNIFVAFIIEYTSDRFKDI